MSQFIDGPWGSHLHGKDDPACPVCGYEPPTRRGSLAIEMSIKLRTWLRGDMDLGRAEFEDWLRRYDDCR